MKIVNYQNDDRKSKLQVIFFENTNLMFRPPPREPIADLFDGNIKDDWIINKVDNQETITKDEIIHLLENFESSISNEINSLQNISKTESEEILAKIQELQNKEKAFLRTLSQNEIAKSTKKLEEVLSKYDLYEVNKFILDNYKDIQKHFQPETEQKQETLLSLIQQLTVLLSVKTTTFLQIIIFEWLKMALLDLDTENPVISLFLRNVLEPLQKVVQRYLNISFQAREIFYMIQYYLKNLG
ncbi:hypothetical protein TRFO_23437 [Tritrichomonas foetus]|uniref:Enhancer of mRNA-decapping protein 4 C-terminal domain-containing protein n=1 Tax=Tritrichomonas foetus TaxID=1144522 RepID=A0A1J4K9L8_9EUKA|nr:hypothetical protein TRFO_23437 [Tritrichomonas foetus]|eukprot:OHT08153.1 hypothetical protein TRFO_23437 [Tritrichomonas foetus]